MTKFRSIFLTILFTLSISIFGQSAEMNPDAAKLYNEGNSLVKAGQYNEALGKYDQALAIEPNVKMYYQKSVAQKKLRKFKDAEQTLLKGIELDPNFISSYTGLGTTYYSLKEYGKAIDNFNKYIEKSDNPKQNKKIQKYVGLSYTQLGQASKADGNYEEAVGHLLEATKNYEYDAAYLSLAEIYNELGKYDEALQAADKAINVRKKIAKGAPYYYKGLAFKGLGNKEKAKENFTIAAKDKQYKNSANYELKNLK
ncbi:MAG: tetratricopeptide repeat protein [Bacteroidota bacterium]